VLMGEFFANRVFKLKFSSRDVVHTCGYDRYCFAVLW
jgi:hypothetical protein